ncbi:hypothetical protein KZ686_24245 [Cupriavidus cauae]|uniref:Uncharacterized protein n=1 Tax=Cupriavidus cauae TaxID=2608999 RepID=A0A5M8AFH1_9BURK|nr:MULTISPECIES: hypothetical protein [Cupriavidus]KAA6120991.1 hypothetical protein F1599_17765 [Cupriavidus cauae]MCA7082555.1 hypothetical protein [Cupriavidus sp. DB3]UZN51419.1 hypothetical protein KZ686_24245 [Cupriavidus cauae]
MQWIADHSQLISALTGVGTLLVWVIYLQVFVSSYRRQLRATLLITRGPGDGLAARCFVTNMSSGPVYVQSVIVALETPGGMVVMPATETQDAEQQAYSRPLERTRQGPLQPAAIRDIGSFEHLMSPALQEARPETVQAVTIVVLGVYGTEDLPIGARRRFVVTPSGARLRLHGATLDTEQIRKKSERRKLLADLQRDQ